MKILQINCVYREGSTGKIVASVADTLRAQGHEVLTCYGLGKADIDEHSMKLCSNMEHNFNSLLSRIIGIPYGGIHPSNIRIKKVIKKFKPDVVHVHCVNAATINVYSFLKYLAKVGIKTILTLHAEIFHTAGCEHAYDCMKWKEGCHDCKVYKQRVHSWFFERSKVSYQKMFAAVNAFPKDKFIVTAVSPWLANRAKQSAIMQNYNVIYVPNGVDTSVFHYRENKGLIDRGQYQKVILFVTPYFRMEETDVKGGRYLLQIATSLPDYKFIVVASLMSASLPTMPENVQLWGRAKTQEELAQLYSEADITLLLSKRETFSMVTAESLCCGTPVIGFRAGGPESIALAEYCEFVEYGDISLICSSLNTMSQGSKTILSSYAIDQYSVLKMTHLFSSLYE